jgi:hypothetical protein
MDFNKQERLNEAKAANMQLVKSLTNHIRKTYVNYVTNKGELLDYDDIIIMRMMVNDSYQSLCDLTFTFYQPFMALLQKIESLGPEHFHEYDEAISMLQDYENWVVNLTL